MCSLPLIFLCSHFALIPSSRNRKLVLQEEKREGGIFQAVLCCLINHANQWGEVRGPLTHSETPQSAIPLKARTQWRASHRWKLLKQELHWGKLGSKTPVPKIRWKVLTRCIPYLQPCRVSYLYATEPGTSDKGIMPSSPNMWAGITVTVAVVVLSFCFNHIK